VKVQGRGNLSGKVVGGTVVVLLRLAIDLVLLSA